jgi:hypothetical protein
MELGKIRNQVSNYSWEQADVSICFDVSLITHRYPIEVVFKVTILLGVI